MPADLRTIAGVELVKVGRWQVSTGPWRVTPELLAAAVDAHRDGKLPAPVVKIGHDDERFDGEPALGRVVNLRLADAGRTLVGDFAGVPGWLAEIAASAFPRRSVEAVHDLELSDGTKYPLVLTAVALLGVTRPGITTLADLRDLYGVAASAGTPVRLTEGVSQAHTPDPAGVSRPRPTLTAAQRVQLRAAAQRRRHRAATAILAALHPEQEK